MSNNHDSTINFTLMYLELALLPLLEELGICNLKNMFTMRYSTLVTAASKALAADSHSYSETFNTIESSLACSQRCCFFHGCFFPSYGPSVRLGT